MHQVDGLADAFAEVSPFSFGLNNPVMNIDPTGDSTVPAAQVNINSFGRQNNRHDGERRGAEEPIKGGGFPKGEIRSTTEQQAVLRPADGLHYTDTEKASQLGVNISWTVEGGLSLMKLGQWFKSLVGLGKTIQETALAAEGGSQLSTRFVSTSKGLTDLEPTLSRIASGGKFPHRNDGSIFKNIEGLLPKQNTGFYQEFVHPTPGITGPGPMRIVTSQNGGMWFTPDHYKTFIPIR